ncbi:Mth938-like domain-containing protein [Planktotalea arctica]|uniref:Mth938-like domain-containing protein n=1 Tax=Planktotalea arctica TaxID=1481893 RepID=UPI000A16FEB1|nr:Mth938-like domain-containing protein [Planktotalea arctica]
MRMTEIEFNDAQPVEGYGPGFFRIAGKVIEAPMIVTASGARPWGGFDDVEPLLAMAGEIDVIFIGTGDEIAYLPKGLRARLDEVGIGAEAMNSPAACRTYNVLVNDGRRVAAALLAVTK